MPSSQDYRTDTSFLLRFLRNKKATFHRAIAAGWFRFKGKDFTNAEFAHGAIKIIPCQEHLIMHGTMASNVELQNDLANYAVLQSCLQ